MRKGQAAVEYLTTYGWAILALIIVLAVLLSSGILSPGYVISEECSMGTNMPCAFALYNEGGATKISLRLVNGFSYRINATSLSLSGDDGSTVAWAGTVPPLLLESGENVTLTGTVSRQVAAGVVKKFTANLTYVSCAPEINGSDCSVLPHTILGRVTGKVLE